MSQILERLKAVLGRIERAAQGAQRRAEEISILAVSKGQPVTAMEEYCEAARSLGVPACFGENYYQEFAEKRELLRSPAEVHFIGRLQRNKVPGVVKIFDLLQSLDSPRLAAALNLEAKKRNRAFPAYLQVNISADPAKAGFSREEALPFLMQARESYPWLEIQGLMTITEHYEAPEAARDDYRSCCQLWSEARRQLEPGRPFALSMGMSADFEVAIQEGATVVRIGTAIFGERKSAK